MFLTRMPYAGRAGSGWRAPSLPTAVSPIEAWSRADQPPSRSYGAATRAEQHRRRNQLDGKRGDEAIFRREA